MDKGTVDLLMKEKELVRHELLLNIKILFSSLYSFLGVFAVLLVFYYNKDNTNDSITQSYVLFLIQQIGVVVLLFNIHLNSMIMTLAGYCTALEERINTSAGEKISIWESVVIQQVAGKLTSVQSLSIFILNLIYLFAIGYLEMLIQQKEFIVQKEYNSVYLIIVILEGVLLVAMSYFVYKQKGVAYKSAKTNFETPKPTAAS